MVKNKGLPNTKHDSSLSEKAQDFSYRSLSFPCPFMKNTI